MGTTVAENRPPAPVIVLVAVSLVVVAMLLAQSAIGVLYGIVRLVLILAAFGAIGAVGFYLWRRGDLRKPEA